MAIFKSIYPGSSYVFSDGVAGFFNDGEAGNQLKVDEPSKIKELRAIPAIAGITEVVPEGKQ